MNRHRAIVALAVSLAMVIVLAALLPRTYLANDDVGLTEYLRRNTYTPWISPILVRALSFAYGQAPAVPWYGLYQYALLVALGAVLVHTCMELVDQRRGPGRNATLFGGVVLIASHAIIVIGITWTAVSISALGTALAAFIAYALICEATGKPMSRTRALLYGLVFVAGYMLRYHGLGAVVPALGPLVAWAAWRFAMKRHLPRVTAVIAFLAPFVVVLAVQGYVRVADQNNDWDRFNEQRGRIHGQAAYDYIDKLAPELLERAGWTLESYRDFLNWRVIDEDEFPVDKVKRLSDTGGATRPLELRRSYRALREIVDDSPTSVLVFVMAVVAGVALSWLGVIGRGGAAFSVGYLAVVTGVALWTAVNLRFPQRVSIAYFTVAALGLYVYLARAIADRRSSPEAAMADGPRGNFVRVVVAVLALGWARNLAAWIDRDPWPHAQELQAFEDRVATRKGFIFIYVQAGQVHHDPLRAVPRAYEGLGGGWGAFSPAWYRTIARLGVHRGAEVFGAMLDNPDAYVVAFAGSRYSLEDWIQRKLHNGSARLALVDGAAIAGGLRPELYHLVSTPLTPGSEEWQARERLESTLADLLPGPPSVAAREFKPIAFVAPYEQYVARLRQPGTGVVVAPIAGGLRAEGNGDAGDTCATPASGAKHVGVHVPVNGLGAARFEIKLIDPENVVGFHVYARTRTSRSIHWRWDRDPEVQRFDSAGTFTLMPGYPAHQLQLAFNTARPAEVTALYFFAAVKPQTHGGFELRNLEVARP